MELNLTLYIKNMVCYRCVLMVEQVVAQLGIPNTNVSLGTIVFGEVVAEDKLNELHSKVHQLGFKVLIAKQDITVDRIKQKIIQIVHSNERMMTKLSVVIAEQLDVEYSYATKLFSTSESITIEKFYIYQRIEKVKEYISYDELTLAEISHIMHYSDLSHLSKQFKQVVGVSPSHYKKEQKFNRHNLDNLII